jgi:hypothetical protein
MEIIAPIFLLYISKNFHHIYKIFLLDPDTGEWRHRNNRRYKYTTRKWLGNVQYDAKEGKVNFNVETLPQ